MNPKFLAVYLLLIWQLQLLSNAQANQTLWSTVSPSGTYAVARPESNSTSKDNSKAADGDRATEFSIVNIETQRPVLSFSGFKVTDFEPLGLVDDSSIQAFCAWAPQEDHLLIVNAVDPSACLQLAKYLAKDD